MTAEYEPKPRREVLLLQKLGREDCIGKPAPGYDGILGDNFLDAYPADKAAARQDTEDMVDGFLEMSPTDPEYPEALAMMHSYVTAFLGAPPEA